MPFSRITLRQGYSETQLQKISDILHQSLTEEFDVPPDDRFQVIETLPASQRIFDRHYQSNERSDNFVLVQIIAGKPRTAGQKQSFYHVLSERLNRGLNIHPDDVMVIIQYNNAADWSFSNGRMYCPGG
ncbi:tautomerase family protein [Serratia fonticola]|uniref:tautomerase family protein n=1 Tax=Serratia fonticola TaxID=47917 RepID=UPI0003F6D015|nr:tautomerase family protein [Serratia fonticola]